MRLVKNSLQFLQLLWARFRQDACATRAAALAFTTLLSLVPLMTVSFTVLTAFPVFHELANKIQVFVIQNFVAASAEVVQQNLQTFVQQASKLSAIGMLFLLVTAVLMVFNMEQAFNAIWRVRRQRSYVSAFLLYWGVLTLTPILLGVGIAITSYLISLPWISVAAASLGLKKFFYIVPYVSTLVAFTILYQAVPNCTVRFRYAFMGGIVASILFELIKIAFVFYIVHLSVYKMLYGPLAAAPIFLVWVYLCWLIILFGALLSATLSEKNKESNPNIHSHIRS